MLPLGFFYASVLIVAGLGGWVLRRPPMSKPGPVRWTLVLFPVLLAATILLKPGASTLWLRWMPAPNPWDRLILVTALILVSLRGICKIVDVVIGWARMRHETISARSLAEAPWLGYQAMALMVGVHPPELRFHHALRTPVVVGWRHPVILFPARLLPRTDRGREPFWDAVEAGDATPALIQAMLFHELEHVRRHDHDRLALLVLNGILLPWEWVSTRAGPGSGFRPWRWLRALARTSGLPYRRAIQAEHRLQENLADARVLACMSDGQALLERARSPDRTPPMAQVPDGTPWRAWVFGLVVCGLLWIAPSLAIVRISWEGIMTQLHDLPNTWSLTLEPGFGKASAGLLKGLDGAPGQIHVQIDKLVPGHPPMLIGAGLFDLSDLPRSGWIELTWDILRDGATPGQEKMDLLIAAFRMMLDTRQDSVAVESEPGSPPEPLADNWHRFRRRLKLDTGQSGACWLYLKYTFQNEGRWVFAPPVVEIVTPDGQRRPFPAA